jgi:hypothetical protein
MHTRLRHVALGLALVFTPVSAIVLHAAPCSAQAPDAAARFAEAQALFDKGSFEEALAKFRPLADETKSPNVLLYVARSLRELGRTTEAYDAMQLAVRVSTERAVAEEKYAPTRDAASAELAILALKVSHVVVAIADAPDGATVKLDGTALTPAQVGSSITVAPGDHTVELEVPGADTVRRAVSVAAGESKTIALAAGQAKQKEAPPPPPPKEEGSSGSLRTVGFIVGGVGAASLVVGVVTGLMANGEFSTLEDECGSSRCTDPSAADTIDSGKSLETVANVTLIGGAVLVAAAIPLVIFGGPSEKSGQASLSASPEGASLRWRTSF